MSVIPAVSTSASFRSAFLAVAVLAAARHASAQTVITRISSLGYTESSFVQFDEPMEMPQPVPAAEGTPDKSPKKPTPREEKLKKLDYDRRPSAVLAAWANPPKPEEDAKTGDEQAKAGDPTATPATDSSQTASIPAVKVGGLTIRGPRRGRGRGVRGGARHRAATEARPT